MKLKININNLSTKSDFIVATRDNGIFVPPTIVERSLLLLLLLEFSCQSQLRLFIKTKSQNLPLSDTPA